MAISKAIPSDAKKLTELTFRSKAFWNYGSEQIEAWREDLTITPNYISNYSVYQLIMEGNLIGYYSYFSEENKTAKLDNLFIEPACIGKGYGKILMNDFLVRVKSEGFQKARLDADPNAEKFYQKLGFKVIGQLPTSIKNRFLPIMEMEVN